MKKQIIFILLITSLTCFAETESYYSPFDNYLEGQETNNELSILAAIGSGFNYQGELLDSGFAVVNNHDFSFQLFDALAGGSQIGSTVIKGNRPVDGGLFSIEDVDFGDAVYTGDELWLSVTVRETGNPGSETTLSPRQRIHSVPYAVQSEFGSSPWTVNGSNIYYTSGNIGVGTTNPLQDFVVDGTTNGDVMRVNVNGSTKFLIDDNGGVGIGSLSTPPVNGLDIEGDVKQPIESNGLMKYMVHARCGGSNPQLILNSYNGVSSSAISLVSGATIPFSCRIKFPTLINNRYFQVTAMGSAGTTGQGASCFVLQGVPGQFGDTLECLTFRTDTGAFQNGNIMVLVY